MNSFIVMQGQSYQEDIELGIIWVPLQDKGGLVPHSWKRMEEVSKGDRVFHYVKGNIVAISIAEEECVIGKKPTLMENEDHGNEEGYLVKLDYHELDQPLNIHEYFHEICPLLPVKYSPFNQDANGNQGYLYPCNEELAIKLLEILIETNIYQVSEEQLEFGIDEVKSTEHNTLIPVITETESEAKAKIRIGQQKFRKELFPLWNDRCALCGIDLPQLVKATHSKPWKDSTNEERVDPYNGVLLCRNHEALYDHGFITFDGQGRLHISPMISEEEYGKYELNPMTKIELYPENRDYFKWHKKHIYKMK
ncbi:HNH endonuclease [Mesobacillus maritimus]|uniref:HNH endonuclease n=1 Tax=Mesobacillus maritimus TaxID=1643336 RepID=UPI00203FA128|nr:HNH endonuclease [Mesobacillus maritimus]MCM3671048.1 HNH endonuclease [Mesobacillus maritimus]